MVLISFRVTGVLFWLTLYIGRWWRNRQFFDIQTGRLLLQSLLLFVVLLGVQWRAAFINTFPPSLK